MADEHISVVLSQHGAREKWPGPPASRPPRRTGTFPVTASLPRIPQGRRAAGVADGIA